MKRLFIIGTTVNFLSGPQMASCLVLMRCIPALKAQRQIGPPASSSRRRSQPPSLPPSLLLASQPASQPASASGLSHLSSPLYITRPSHPRPIPSLPSPETHRLSTPNDISFIFFVLLFSQLDQYSVVVVVFAVQKRANRPLANDQDLFVCPPGPCVL